MKIKRREIRVAPSTEDDKVVRFCPHCLEYNFEVPLGPRILFKGESKPVDYLDWLQCDQCGNIYAVRDIQVESEISSDFTATDDPFDIGGSIVGLGNKKRMMRREGDAIDS